MTPIHFDVLEPVFAKHGYNVVLLKNDDRNIFFVKAVR